MPWTVRSLKTIGSRSFPQAGWYVIRRDRDYCLVSCGYSGPNGTGGHAHNDKLSIELMLDGRDVVVDPGTYLYTPRPEIRNRFRSTGHHNTVKVNGCEQSEPLNGDMFRLADRTTIRLARLAERPGRISFEGEIVYADVVHRRAVRLDRPSNRWTIEDRVSCPRSCGAEAVFHLPPHAASHGGDILDENTGTPLASMEIEGGRAETRRYDYSPRYGACAEAPCLYIRIPSLPGEAAITTVFSHRGLAERTS